MQSEHLQLERYQFTLEAIEPITLPAYKGSAFHGGFGHSLMQISPTWYKYFFESGPGNKTDWPKPFVLLPPLEETENYQENDQFTCELTLFGDAIKHHSIAQAAMEHLGMQMGLGYTRGKYRVINIETLDTPQKLNSQDTINLNFTTRLRLKDGKRLYQKAPTFYVLMARLLGRIKTLQHAYSQQQMDHELVRELLQLSKEISISQNKLKWDNWERFSGRQKKWMSFGGLMGEVSYAGDLKPFMEHLDLGQWLHIGGKSSFGLGKYEIKR